MKAQALALAALALLLVATQANAQGGYYQRSQAGAGHSPATTPRARAR